MKAEVKADGSRKIRVEDGHLIELSSLVSGMKSWSRAHRGPLTLAAIHALRLQANNLNCMKSALHVIVAPSGKQPPHDMKILDAFSAPLEESKKLLMVSSPNLSCVSSAQLHTPV